MDSKNVSANFCCFLKLRNILYTQVMANKFSSKVSLDSLCVPRQAMKAVTEQQRRAEQERIRVKDKACFLLTCFNYKFC